LFKLGVIGGGVYGTQVLQAFHGAHRRGRVNLAAFADINPEVVARQEKQFGVKGYVDYREMFDKEKPDAVAVVTPDYLHREIAVEAANRGIHVLVQKPIDTDPAGARDMIEAADKNNVVLFVDFHKRFDPAHIRMRNDVRSGKLGKLQYGYVWMEDRIEVPSVWFQKWAQHSSPAWFLGVHFFDLIYWITGERPDRVFATGVKHKLLSMGIDTYDSLQAKFMFPSGFSITVDSSWILPGSFPSIVNQGIRLVGSEGICEVDTQDRGVLCAYSGESGSEAVNPFGKLDVEHPFHGLTPQGYTIESMIYFIDIVEAFRNGKTLAELKPFYPNGEEALVSTEMCRAAHESAETGRIVSF